VYGYKIPLNPITRAEKMKILGMHIGIWYINIGTPFAEDMVGEWACA